MTCVSKGGHTKKLIVFELLLYAKSLSVRPTKNDFVKMESEKKKIILFNEICGYQEQKRDYDVTGPGSV